MTRRVCLMAFSMFMVWCYAVLWVRGSDPDTGKKTITNSIGMKLVLIPAGEFQMGSQKTAEELSLFRDDHPWHRVRITKPFYLGVYEVTVGEFGKFVSDTGYKTDAERNKDFEGAEGFNVETGWFDRFSSRGRRTRGVRWGSRRGMITRW